MQTVIQLPGLQPAAARMRVEGALEALGFLRAELDRMRAEADELSGPEALDETLGRVDGLVVRYLRQQTALPSIEGQYASRAFLLDGTGETHPLPHGVYLALVRGEAAAPQFAGQTLRLAEWYLRLHDDEPTEIVNETYTFLVIDHEGRADWRASPEPQAPPAASANPALPTTAERERMQAALFGEPSPVPACPLPSGSK